MLALFLYPQYARKEVNAMPYIPKDQIAAAREMDLLTYGDHRRAHYSIPASDRLLTLSKVRRDRVRRVAAYRQ